MPFADRMKSALDVASSVALIAAAGALGWAIFLRSPTEPRGQEPQIALVSGLHVDAANVRNISGRGSIAIVEFSDFQCPFCAKHAQDTLPTLKRDLLAKGDVQYVALHFPIETIHPMALSAGEASECAGSQGRFWDMHEQLFRDPKALGPEALVGHAEAIGLDVPAFQHCLDSDETVEKIRRDQAEGRRLGVSGTPAFFIGTVRPDGGIDLRKRIRGIVSAEVFAAEVADLRS